MPLDPSLWCAVLQRDFPRVRVDVESVFPALGGQIAETVRLRGAGARDALAALVAHPATFDHEVLATDESSCAVRFRLAPCPACDFAKWNGLTPTFPLVLSDGACGWRLETTKGDRRDVMVRYWTEASSLLPQILGESGRGRELTARQREVLRAAVFAGYYASPRRITIAQLAGRLSLAPSTLSGLLQKIEAKVLEAAAERGS